MASKSASLFAFHIILTCMRMFEQHIFIYKFDTFHNMVHLFENSNDIADNNVECQYSRLTFYMWHFTCISHFTFHISNNVNICPRMSSRNLHVLIWISVANYCAHFQNPNGQLSRVTNWMWTRSDSDKISWWIHILQNKFNWFEHENFHTWRWA